MHVKTFFFLLLFLNQFEIGKRGAVKTTILGRKNLYISRAFYVSHTHRGEKASKKFPAATKALSFPTLQPSPPSAGRVVMHSAQLNSLFWQECAGGRKKEQKTLCLASCF